MRPSPRASQASRAAPNARSGRPRTSGSQGTGESNTTWPTHRPPPSPRARKQASVTPSPGSQKRARWERTGESTAPASGTAPYLFRAAGSDRHGPVVSVAGATPASDTPPHREPETGSRTRSPGLEAHAAAQKKGRPPRRGKAKTHLLRASRKQNAAQSTIRPHPHTAIAERAERAPCPQKAGPD
ncbi:hypothetical protein NDU88_002876 [Pleurodeles waltl]|uniref:Uncharacterized protein n=1 Tax=Pleurodeles waltl TaxID=8319 RepID=A0AAV7RGT7_PLEWA|nr:hypothetical protein NDU88_002876 [Pleurodeles waltl]